MHRIYPYFLALIAGFFLCFAPVSSVSAQNGVPLVGIAEAQQLKDSGKNVLFLDVRTQAEYNAGHIDGALLIPLDQLPSRYAEVPKDQDVIVYCRSGRRSAEAVALLQDKGYTRVKGLDGGFLAWEQSTPKP
ncbi:MAG: rhodanese-like domain-containing protein [Alphaproteobacteria bacterium]|nr:rhodanese-like domain-containing protein [Alphaproteobacteria bacterium]